MLTPEATTGDVSFDVVAIGSALVDVLARPPRRSWTGSTWPKAPWPWSIWNGPHRSIPDGAGTEVSGGSAANTAVGVAALGGRVGFIGKVADDALGKVFRHDITAAGVTVGTSLSEPGVTSGGDAADEGTGRCLVLVTEDGERTMATHLGVASTFARPDIDEDLVARRRSSTSRVICGTWIPPRRLCAAPSRWPMTPMLWWP